MYIKCRKFIISNIISKKVCYNRALLVVKKIILRIWNISKVEVNWKIIEDPKNKKKNWYKHKSGKALFPSYHHFYVKISSCFAFEFSCQN